jgi:hypothetical protein
LSVVYAWPAPNGRIHDRQVALCCCTLLLQVRYWRGPVAAGCQEVPAFQLCELAYVVISGSIFAPTRWHRGRS